MKDFFRTPDNYLRRFSDVRLPAGRTADAPIAISDVATFSKGVVQPGDTTGPRVDNYATQFLFILNGRLDVQVGGNLMHAGPDDLVIIPRTLAYEIVNPGPDPDLHLAIATPSGAVQAAEQGSLASDTPTETLLYHVDRDAFGPGLNRPDDLSVQRLANRATNGIDIAIRSDLMRPGAHGPGMHVHKFDQYFFVLDGEITVAVVDQIFVARRHELVRLPAGVPHRQWNASDANEYCVTVAAPEPPAGEVWDVEVEFRGDFDWRRAPRQAE